MLSSRTYSVQIFFPQGRHPGAPYTLARLPRTGERPLDVVLGQLDSGGGASGIELCLSDSGPCCERFRGGLEGRNGDLSGQVTYSYSCRGDLLYPTYVSDGAFLNYGAEAPAGSVLTSSTPRVPTDGIAFVPTVPLDNRFTARTEAMSGGKKIAGGYVQTETSMSLIPEEGFPPNESISVKGSGLVDVMGRPVTFDTMVAPAVTSKQVTDLTLATQPPDGSVVGMTWSSHKAELALDNRYLGGPPPKSGMVSLGDSQAFLKLRLRIFDLCKAGSTARAAIVAANGRTTNVPIGCGTQTAPVAVAFPGAGPMWLSVSEVSWDVSSGNGGQVTVQDLTFEP